MYLSRILCSIFFPLGLALAAQAQTGPNQAQAGPHQAQAGPNQANAGPTQAQADPNRAQADPNQAQAVPSVQEIINKYLQAMGGKERLQSINSLYQEGIAVLENGAQLNSKSWRVYDRVYRQEVVMPAGKVIILVTPSRGWSSGPGTGGVFKPLTDVQFKSLRPEIDPGGPLVDYGAKGNKVELVGKDTVNGQICYELRVSFPNGGSTIYSLDVRTGYILRASHKGGNVLATLSPGTEGHPDAEVVTEYGDYKVIPGGYVFPHTIMLSPYGAKVKITKIQVNGEVDADVLSKPK